MESTFSQWVEKVREKPEHIRRRYVFLCAIISMILILGVWFLTVTESFQAVSTETGNAVDNTRSILPKPSNFSLDQFLNNKESLGTDKDKISGQQYFENQYQGKTQPNINGEGVTPVPPPTEGQGQ